MFSWISEPFGILNRGILVHAHSFSQPVRWHSPYPGQTVKQLLPWPGMLLNICNCCHLLILVWYVPLPTCSCLYIFSFLSFKPAFCLPLSKMLLVVTLFYFQHHRISSHFSFSTHLNFKVISVNFIIRAYQMLISGDKLPQRKFCCRYPDRLSGKWACFNSWNQTSMFYSLSFLFYFLCRSISVICALSKKISRTSLF